MIKLGSLPTLFPSLVNDITKTSELTVIRHCADKLRKRKSFSEGDLVIVYDNFTKLSYDAVVSEVLGTNNYLVMSDNGSKHVSGDVMSRATRAQPDVVAPPAAAAAPPAAAAAVDNVDDNIVVDDDNLSVISDISEDLILPNSYANTNVRINNNNRRGRRELNNLGPIQNMSRLRSGRN